MERENNSGKSLVMLISSMLIFGTIGIFRRGIPLSSPLLACFRGLSGSVFLFLLVKIRKKQLRHGIGPKKVLLLALSGVIMGFNWILLFEAFNHTTVATATLCYYMEPTIVILLSPLIFKEKLTGKKLLCVAVAIVGMVFVSGVIESGAPSVSEFRGLMLGLGAAVLYSGLVIMNKLIPGIDSYEKTIIQLLSASVIILPYLLLTEDFSSISLNLTQTLMLLIVGFVHTGLSYALYFGSMDSLKSQTIAIFSYIDPISALILSAVFLNDRMTAFGIIGAVLILGAAAASEIEFKK